MVDEVGNAAAPPTAAVPRAGGALVVVLSPTTLQHLDALARAGWQRPVLMVGSVAEAREVLRGAVPDRSETHAREPRRHVAPLPGPDEPHRLRLDADRRVVLHAHRTQALTPLEFGVLETLLARPGQVVRFAELTRTVWGTTFTGDCSHLHAVIRRLRRKLDGVQAPADVVAVRGVGFRLARRGADSAPDAAAAG